MKLRTFLAVAAIAAFAACGTPYRATNVNGTEIQGIIVSDNIKSIFSSQYPNATDVVWTSYNPNVVILNDWELSGWPTMDASDFVVRVKMDNEDYYAWYDNDGTWIGSAYVVKDYSTLPSSVNTLNTRFPGYRITA